MLIRIVEKKKGKKERKQAGCFKITASRRGGKVVVYPVMVCCQGGERGKKAERGLVD